ncbi:NAD(P)/FAD-dependent oxidoreductase [Mycolicibacterium sp. YH-1]|uniref:flavin monoamine oxidase family protein n=1 Tax=Mycolicibacterium sp. YH-1 TaxID=2908837 RepID=UPI001F4C19A2|nr:NAD(P)/FAD-dependent oxidoreductase [Mycolicibacterium sp. YH-1]UNB52966.1 FAD-dependent oxidoreductase [Mycolicibacterium sp. YH-1]
MSKLDVVVIGAGLAGLAAARDLTLAGADVVVLEARTRPGGRVEQCTTDDGRRIQLGGEIIGTFHTAYKKLVGELGLTIGPTFTQSDGETAWVLSGHRFTGADLPWMSDADRRCYDRIEQQFAALAGTVDPDDPWSHSDALALDRISLGQWLRDAGATGEVVRALELAHLALAVESVERSSLLAILRKESAAGAEGFYNYDAWENERVVEGSATVALRMAEQLGDRIRYGSVVSGVSIEPGGVNVDVTSGERLTASDVVMAVPAGPLRDIRITGVSDEKLASLWHQKHAMAAKFVAVYRNSFWEDARLDGTSFMEHNILGGTWAQGDGVLSGLVPPGRIGAYLATPAHLRERNLLDDLVTAFGSEAAQPLAAYMRSWATDPYTQGYVTAWRPGDLTAVGPLHGKHEPPFYVCGSDQWVAGYMEGAVRTGRDTAQTLLHSR